MTANWKYDISDIVIFNGRELLALSNYYFISHSAVVLFIMSVELAITTLPQHELSVIVVSCYKYLKGVNNIGQYSDCLVHLSMSNDRTVKFASSLLKRDVA